MAGRRRGAAWGAAVVLVWGAASAEAREVVPFERGARPGSIVVRTAERRLYYVVGDGTAIRYPVAVGRPGKQWQGAVEIRDKFVRPGWTPPPVVRADHPDLPDVVPSGSPRNPLGSRVMTLSDGPPTGGQYAIHGTNRPDSIGAAASYGCIRMRNEDVADLYERVGVGTQVVVQR